MILCFRFRDFIGYLEVSMFFFNCVIIGDFSTILVGVVDCKNDALGVYSLLNE